jgi:acetyl esterase/lipase
MSYELDAELAPVLASGRRDRCGRPGPHGHPRALLTGRDHHAVHHPTSDGNDEIELRWYTNGGTAPGSAIVYAHGGGMIGRSLDLYDKVVCRYVRRTGVPFLSVGYRLAPEATSSTGLAEDVFTALKWLTGPAAGFEVDPARIAVMGDSGGGGPVAGAAILGRERNIP